MPPVQVATLPPKSIPVDASGQFDLARSPHRIGVVTLVVRDLALVGNFYKTVLGLRTIATGQGFERLGAGGKALLELRHIPNAQIQSRRDAGLFHTAFLLPSREELGSWLRFAAEARVHLQGASDHLVSEAIYLSDPEGNGIEVYRDRPVANWKIKDGAIAMASDPLDLDGLMKAAAGSVWSGFPDAGTIGHVHLQVGATALADTFYEQLLGFSVTGRYPGASFYGSGGYHHQLAGNIWNSRGAPPRQPDVTGLAELELLSPDPAVLSQTSERISAAGYAASQSANRVELRDPWGVTIRLRLG